MDYCIIKNGATWLFAAYNLCFDLSDTQKMLIEKPLFH